MGSVVVRDEDDGRGRRINGPTSRDRGHRMTLRKVVLL